jgi:ParB family chromosome partitioning protein
MTKKALGRGLEALIPTRKKEPEKDNLPTGKVEELDIETISPNRYQPRRRFDEEKLEELSASLREKGVIEPVIVRAMEEGYELIAGERRLQAAKRLGMGTIPAVVRAATDREMLELSLIENLQRDDLNPLEEALSYQRLMGEFGLTQEKLAQDLGKNRASVANTLRLLNLPEQVREALLHNGISRGHAIALLSLKNAAGQVKLCRKIVRHGLSVRKTEVAVKRALTPGLTGKPASGKSPEFVAIEEGLQHFFGTRVNIRRRRAGGRIEVDYYSDEDLERILSLLGVKAD